MHHLGKSAHIVAGLVQGRRHDWRTALGQCGLQVQVRLEQLVLGKLVRARWIHHRVDLRPYPEALGPSIHTRYLAFFSCMPPDTNTELEMLQQQLGP